MPEVSSNAGDARLPHHFAAFVEIFFAVVLGASILEPEIRGLLFPPAVTNLGFWALVAVYFTAITSWMGWHKSTIEFPYTDSGAGQVRSVLDAVVVVTYAALLFFASRIGAFLTWYLWGFVTIFALYYFAGKLRRAEHHTPLASKIYLIVYHGVAILVGAVACTVLSKILSHPPVALLWVFVLLPLPSMVSYRWFREWRTVPWTAPKRKLTIAVDMDGVLVEQVVPVLQKLKQEAGVDLDKCDITDWEYPFKGTNIKVEIERAEQEEEFVRGMPPMKNAREVLRLLSKKFDLIIATGRDPLTDGWSRDWLNDHGIPYRRFINTHSEGKSLSGVDLLIDDYIGNIEEFIRKGPPDRQAILFAQPWNYDTGRISGLIASGRVRIAHSWQAVLALLGCGLSEVEPVKKVQTPQAESQVPITREHLSLQALSCFLAGFLFVRSSALSGRGASLFLQTVEWLCIPLAGVFLALAFLFMMTAFFPGLQGVARRNLRVFGLSVSVASMAGIIVAWMDGIKGLTTHALWLQVFFWVGFIFLLIYGGHFIFSCWRYGRVSKTKQ